MLVTRRVALFSDVHGNLPALEAVLGDIDAAGPGEVYCLGDLVGYGPRPGDVIDRIRQASIPTLRGNYDDGVGNRRGDCGCYYASQRAKADGEASFAFTQAALSEEQTGWLGALPHEFRLEHEGLKLLLVHGSPRKVNEYLLPDRQDRQLIRLAQQADADVVCVGHVHLHYHRAMSTAEGRVIHYVSAGSAGKPKDGDQRAGWVELVLGTEEDVRSSAFDDRSAGPVGASAIWLGTVVHRVAYDVESVAGEMLAAGLPKRLADALRRS